MKHHRAVRPIVFAIMGLLTGGEPPRGFAQTGGAWVGLEVITRYGTELKPGVVAWDDPSRGPGPAKSETDKTARRIYRVQEINRPWLRLVPVVKGPSGWVQSTQVIPYLKAIDYFTAELRKDSAPHIYIDRASCWLKRGEIDSAKADLDEAIRLDPLSVTAHLIRGLAWLLEKRHDRAIADFDEAIRIDPKCAEAYIDRATSYRLKHESDRAIADLSEAIRLNPDDTRAYQQRGRCWAIKQDYDKAIADLSEAIRLNPHTPVTHRMRAICRERKREFAGALADLSEAVRLDPRYASGQNDRAWLSATCPEAEFRDGPRAVRAATLASELTDYSDPAALSTLAAAYAEAGDFAGAIAWQQKVIYLEADRKRKESLRSRLKLYQEKTPYRGGPEAAARRDSEAAVPEPGETPAEDVPLPGPAPDEPLERIAEERALGLGLKPFRSVRSGHFVAVGNAADSYLRVALRDCEAVARDYQEYYQARGFPVSFPDRPMTVVVLEDQRAFARFRGRTGPTGPVAGIYDREKNWLVVQDFRNLSRSQLAASSWGTNLQVLAHEATHLLTFNTGLLDREGDLPVFLVEGLATYGEVRRPDARSLPGQLNHRRLDDLTHARRSTGWIPIQRLLSDDGWQRNVGMPKSDMAYAEGWLLTDYLISDPGRTQALRNYLDAIRGRRDPSRRLEDARAALGDLDALDVALKGHASKLLAQP
jgi:tetratricopeptide (TPR) repeat protein